MFSVYVTIQLVSAIIVQFYFKKNNGSVLLLLFFSMKTNTRVFAQLVVFFPVGTPSGD